MCFSLHNFPVLPNKEPGPRQCAKKVVCNSLGFIDFSIGPVNSALSFGEFKLQFRTVISTYQIFFFWLVEMTFRLADASCSLSGWQALKLTFFMFANVIQYTSRTNIKIYLLFSSNTFFCF